MSTLPANCFKDELGRTWKFEFTDERAAAAKKLLGIDFFRFANRDFEKLFANRSNFFLATYIACKDQCDRLGLTQFQFYDAILPRAEEISVAMSKAIEVYRIARFKNCTQRAIGAILPRRRKAKR